MISSLAPVVTDLSEPYWNAAKEGRLIAQSCSQCSQLRFPPSPICSSCGRMDYQWIELSGRARVSAWTVTHQTYHPDLAGEVPYTVLLVNLIEQDDLFAYGRYVSSGTPLETGMPLRAVFEGQPHGWTLVNWRAETPDESRTENR